MRLFPILLLGLWLLCPRSLYAQHTLSLNDAGDYELVSISKEYYTAPTPDYTWMATLRDTLVLDLKKEVRLAKPVNKVNLSIKRAYPYGRIQQEQAEGAYTYRVSDSGDLLVRPIGLSSLANLSSLDQNIHATLAYCVLPLPTEAITGKTKWSRQQLRESVRGEWQEKMIMEFTFTAFPELEEVLGYTCHKVNFSGSSGTRGEGHTFSQRGVVHYDQATGKLIKLSTFVSWETNNMGNMMAMSTLQGFAYYQYSNRIELQVKEKRKPSLIKQTRSEWQQHQAELARVRKEYDWAVPPIYHNIEPLPRGDGFIARLGLDFYRLDRQGSPLHSGQYGCLVDAKYGGFVAAHDGVAWQMFNPEWKKSGPVFEQGSLSFNQFGLHAAFANGQWQIVDTSGRAKPVIDADIVYTSSYGFYVRYQGEKRAIGPDAQPLIPPSFEGEGATNLEELGLSFAFHASRSDSIFFFDGAGRLEFAIPGIQVSDAHLPYLSVKTWQGQQLIYDTRSMEQPLGVGINDASSLYYDGQFYIGVDTLTERNYLIRLPSRDTVLQAAFIRQVEQMSNWSRPEQPLFVIGDQPANPVGRSPLVYMVTGDGDTLTQQPYRDIRLSGSYMSATGNDLKTYILKQDGQLLTAQTFAMSPRWLSPHQFLIESSVFNCKTLRSVPLPYGLKCTDPLAVPNAEHDYLIVTDGKKQGLLDPEFNTILPLMVDKVIGYCEQGAIVSIGEKVGVVHIPWH